ncbi:MAG: FHA domain-containing protein [Sedimentisphaerales bacterium]|nr:FHA domain-containing protein [Sedimentisphaerales bacterium]
MASIIVVTGSSKGNYYPLGHRTTVIGRDEAVPVQILDPKVSRKHMKIRFNSDKNTFSALDMSSKHGVLINGNKITDEIELQDNDYITIGTTTLMFTFKDFDSRENALLHYKKVGQRNLPTITFND